MSKMVFATITIAAIVLAALPAPASARQCKRICMEGVCWWDCSKIPGQPVRSSSQQTTKKSALPASKKSALPAPRSGRK